MVGHHAEVDSVSPCVQIWVGLFFSVPFDPAKFVSLNGIVLEFLKDQYVPRLPRLSKLESSFVFNSIGYTTRDIRSRYVNVVYIDNVVDPALYTTKQEGTLNNRDRVSKLMREEEFIFKKVLSVLPTDLPATRRKHQCGKRARQNSRQVQI